jgi:hypothetical protein
VGAYGRVGSRAGGVGAVHAAEDGADPRVCEGSAERTCGAERRGLADAARQYSGERSRRWRHGGAGRGEPHRRGAHAGVSRPYGATAVPRGVCGDDGPIRAYDARAIALPDGSWTAETRIDGYPDDPDPAHRDLSLVARVTKRGEELTLDLTGTAPQVSSRPINMPFGGGATLMKNFKPHFRTNLLAAHCCMADRALVDTKGTGMSR